MGGEEGFESKTRAQFWARRNRVRGSASAGKEIASPY